MMPGVGFEEMILLVVVAIVVIGPKDLPLMMRKFGRFTGKMRTMAFEFKQGFDELGRQAELEELRKEVSDLRKHTGIDDIQKEFEQDRINLEKDVASAMEPAALPPPTPGEPAPGTPAPGTPANGAPAIAPYAGLSADDPGYGAGEDFRIGGHGPGPAPASDPHPEPARSAESKDAPQPVKQDTPA